MENLKKIAEYITKEKDFVVASHVGPDGDSLGGSLALMTALKQLGKSASVSFGDDYVNIPPQYKYLPDAEMIVSYRFTKPAPVFIALECPQESRLGGSFQVAEKATILINIDHHIDNKNYGHVNYVNTEISSTCEILYNLFKILGVKVDKKIATYLYTGIVTDTGRFQYSNTKPSTFAVAEELLKQGVSVRELFQNVYENRSLNRLKLLGMTLAKARTGPEGFIYSVITKEDFSLSTLAVGETEDYIDFLRAGKNVSVAAILKEVGDKEVKVSLRSRNGVDVAKIAEVFGGGGHEAAAGFTSKESSAKTVKRLKEELSKVL